MDVTVDMGYVCDEYTVLGDTVKGHPKIDDVNVTMFL
jgi:hypothetical protein